MSDLPGDENIRVRRNWARGRYDRSTIDRILDAGRHAHIGFVQDDRPMVIPMIYWRSDDHVYWHGSTASRAMRRSVSMPTCFTVTHLDGLVLAKSAFHHSANYRSVVITGEAEEVEVNEKEAALKTFMDRLFPDRWQQLRPIKQQELKATSLLRLKIDKASAKIRAGPPVEDPGDIDWPVWTGIIPIETCYGQLVSAPADRHRYPIPDILSACFSGSVQEPIR